MGLRRIYYSPSKLNVDEEILINCDPCPFFCKKGCSISYAVAYSPEYGAYVSPNCKLQGVTWSTDDE